MKPLAEQFVRKGFRHTAVVRVGGWAIYERQRPDVSKPHWEVVKPRTCPQREAFGQVFEAQEVYPPSEEWGKYGFTYTTLADAQAKLKELTGS